jgi:hypothetical protein
MSAAFDRDALLDAFDRIGRAAVGAGTKLQIAVYGGSALMLASNFRFATEDVDVSKLDHPLPDWLATVVQELADQNHWQKDWFNDGVAFHSARSRAVPPTILSSGLFLAMVRRQGWWFRFRRHSICWRLN